MNEWISIEDKKPKSTFHIVFVTDGQLTALASWIEDPLKYYGEDMMEYDEKIDDYIKLDDEWKEPHWKFETSVGPFIGSDECFGCIEDITHWMPFPKPPM